MISDLIVKALKLLTRVIAVIMPTITLNDSIFTNTASGIASLAKFCADANFILPLPDMVLILSFDIGFRIAKMTLFIMNWVVRRAADVIP